MAMNPSDQNQICYFARSNFRAGGPPFGILLPDRLHHFYVLGKTGSGKTSLLLTKIHQDIYSGHGICIIDVHGDLIQKAQQWAMPTDRKEDVVYLDTTDPSLTLGYNPLKKVSVEKRALIVSNILEIFQTLWGRAGWGVKLSHILRNVFLTLLDQPSANLSDAIRILQDDTYRASCLSHIDSPEVLRFWTREFDDYTKNDLLPIYNKLGGLLSYPSIRRILVTNPNQLSLRAIIDGKKILLVNIAKGSIGSEASYILGSLLLTSLAAAAFSRIDTPESKREVFFCYLDEFHNYTTPSIVDMLSELRKFRLGLIMAHQYISQLDPTIRDAVLGNVGTIVCFRLGYHDARLMEKIFYPEFEASDFVNLSNFDIYLKLMIDGKPSKGFSAVTLSPQEIG